MWQYFVPHCIYHLMRWFPKNNRIKIRVLLILSVMCIIGPQFYVLFNERSARFCPFPLLSFLASSISFTFTMIGFSVLFALMDPVPYVVKIVFHVFGGGLFLYSIVQAIFTFQASECGTYSIELYWYSLADSVLSILSAAFFMLTVPFWVVNNVWKNSVLNREKRMGVCYEPVNCCSCIWHV